jgi:beta-glucosidase
VLSEWDGPVSVYRRGDAPNPQDIQSLHRAADNTSHCGLDPQSREDGVLSGGLRLPESSLGQASSDNDLPDYHKMLKNCEGADVVIAVIGDDPTLNGEERDRANLDLPYAQQKMLETLKEAGHKLIIVGVTGKPLTVKWAKENADAMLWTFCPGMFGGSAVAGVLSGEINPSARLPISFPQHVGQVPVYYNQLPGWHGEKYIDLPKEPLYTFGYGLSYSDFEFSNLTLSEQVCADNTDDIEITVDVKNRSDIDGTSVVQLYFRDVVSSLSTPVKQFKDFKRISLKAGETKTVNLKLPMNELALVNHDLQRVIEKGEFIVYVGDGVYLEKEFRVV